MRSALLLAFLALQAAARVTTTVSSESVAPGEPFELRVRVETDSAMPEIRLGLLPAGLELLQRTTSSQYQARFPAGSSRITVATYTLVGRVPGSFVLPSVSVRVDGREVPGRALSVSVRPPGRAAIDPDLANPPRLTVAAEPKRAYVGQPVVLRADAMFPRELRSRLTRPATYEPPAATGFWVVDLPNPMTLQLQRLGNEVYEVQTHRRVYVPIVAGTHVLMPARLNYEIRYGLLQPPESRFVLSDSLTIEVLELPAQGRPPAFSGAVGSFTMVAGVEPVAVAAGEAATVRVEVRGRGNVRAIAAPGLRAGPSVEVLPPTETAQEDLAGADIGGTKAFRWAVIPKEPGRVALGPIEFAFFDPAAREYRVLRSDSLFLEVAGFSGSEEAQGLSPPDRSPSPPRLGFVRTRAFAFAQALPLLLVLAASVRRRRRAAPASGPAAVRPSSNRVAIARLRAAASRGEPGVADELAALLRRAIAEATATPNRVGSPGADPATAGVVALAAEVDEVRFAPGDDPQRLVDLVERADRLLDAPSTGAGRAPGLIVLLLAVAAAPGPASARTQAASFAEGVTALRAGEPSRARASFEAYLAIQPGDASAWHNLGNAAYREGDRAAATHAWLQALEYDPRHAGARHNLTVVAGAAATRVLKPRFALSDDLALLALAGIWWVALGAAVLSPRRHRAAVLGTLTIAALITGLAWLGGRNAPAAATARADGVAVRTEPTLQSEAVRRLAAGEPLVIEGPVGEWVRVRSLAGELGWIESSRLYFVSRMGSQVP